MLLVWHFACGALHKGAIQLCYDPCGWGIRSGEQGFQGPGTAREHGMAAATACWLQCETHKHTTTWMPFLARSLMVLHVHQGRHPGLLTQVGPRFLLKWWAGKRPQERWPWRWRWRARQCMGHPWFHALPSASRRWTFDRHGGGTDRLGSPSLPLPQPQPFVRGVWGDWAFRCQTLWPSPLARP